MTIVDLNFEELNAVVNRAARNVCQRVANSPYEDLKQDAWEWILTHEDKVMEWHEDSDGGFGRVYRSCYHHCLDAAQGYKAQREGYANHDNYYYSTRQLRRLLPHYYLDEQIEVNGLAAQLNCPDRDAYMDIERGLSLLSERDRQNLFGWFWMEPEMGGVCQILADAEGIAFEAASARINRTVQRLQRKIGGERPVWHTSRSVVTNAAARAALSQTYDGG